MGHVAERLCVTFLYNYSNLGQIAGDQNSGFGYKLGEVIDWRDANPCTKMVVGINPSAGKSFTRVFVLVKMNENLQNLYLPPSYLKQT